MSKKIGVFLFLVLMMNFCLAFEDANFIVSNSADWRDVFSVLNYANLQRMNHNFLVSSIDGKTILKGISKNYNLGIISSDNPLIVNYPYQVRQEGFENVEELKVKDANLDLIEELPEIENFIIVSDLYGYNAIAVAPYAVVSNSWVFLANRANIAEIENILDSRDVNKVIVYGYVDREVLSGLEKYDPEIIYNGDKFKDNIKIVDKYLEVKETSQVLLTNGEFIEKELMSGTSPVLFTGKTNVPDQIREYLEDSSLSVGVLIGNDLVNAATNIRRSTGISVVAKFARSSRNPSSDISSIEGLDLFYVPGPILSLEIGSVRYNKALSQIEVRYESKSNVPTYLMGTFNIQDDNGEVVLGDSEPEFIVPEGTKTLVYSGAENLEGIITASAYVLYGESTSALDYVFEGDFEVSEVNIIDGCEIEIESVAYNKQEKNFKIKAKNLADTDCWADIELRDIKINGAETNIGTESPVKITPGKKAILKIDQRMEEEDLEDNRFVDLYGYYGEKEDSLVKAVKGRYELGIESFSKRTYAIVAIVCLIIILLIVRRNRKNE